MTSDKASIVSEARNLLDFALGKNRVSLGELHPQEFDELINHTLYKVDLRELRGFKSLEDWGGRYIRNQPGFPTDATDHVYADSNTVVENDSPEHELDLKTHVVSAHRSILHQSFIFRRYETGETTQDREKYKSWGSTGYVDEWVWSSLIMRRPNDHSRADENLFCLNCSAKKVPLKNEMTIQRICSQYIPISEFRNFFSIEYPSVAWWLIQELASLTRTTLSELKSKADSFENNSQELARLSSAIMK